MKKTLPLCLCALLLAHATTILADPKAGFGVDRGLGVEAQLMRSLPN